MSPIAERLTSLRQEITDLKNMNTLFAGSSEHNSVEQNASKARASRLLEIKHELSTMRDTPPQAAVWWDKRARQ